MSDLSQFGANKPPSASGPLDCATVDVWLSEAAEGALSPAMAEQLQDHAAGCVPCRNKLAQARRGREWLLVLKQEPLQPPADLMARILAKTSGAADPEALSADGTGLDRKGFGLFSSREGGSGGNSREDAAAPEVFPVPAWQKNSVVVLRRTLLEPRLALVAAMAFFSVSLTLNLMGVRLTSMHPTDLKPTNLRRAVTRQYAEANARVVRYYENLRIVYEVESRVQQLRRAAETATPPEQSGSKPRKGSSDSSNDQNESHGERMSANPHTRQNQHAVPDPVPIRTGPRLDAAFHIHLRPTEVYRDWTASARECQSATQFVFPYAPLASSCPRNSIPVRLRERRLA